MIRILFKINPGSFGNPVDTEPFYYRNSNLFFSEIQIRIIFMTGTVLTFPKMRQKSPFYLQIYSTGTEQQVCLYMNIYYFTNTAVPICLNYSLKWFKQVYLETFMPRVNRMYRLSQFIMYIGLGWEFK